MTNKTGSTHRCRRIAHEAIVLHDLPFWLCPEHLARAKDEQRRERPDDWRPAYLTCDCSSCRQWRAENPAKLAAHLANGGGCS
ncbi:MAG: hypothetical protein EHM24_31810 [Acidobacteria bacterium]|nr:MAG: hypothetical protein EHM24_31810 [Acidobacteriota bacterium]